MSNFRVNYWKIAIIFVSHSSQNKREVGLLVEMLRAINLQPQQDIFCSSLPGYDIPIGTEDRIFDFLRESFLRYDIHIFFVHSHEYYKSPVISIKGMLIYGLYRKERRKSLCDYEYRIRMVGGKENRITCKTEQLWLTNKSIQAKEICYTIEKLRRIILMTKSIEEQVEDWGKKQLAKTKYYTKTESINSEIENALKTAPSKSGGNGVNYPDIKLLIETKSLRKIPVMIEVKGRKGALAKLNAASEIDNIKKDGTPNFNNINRYAVNGAVHYASAIINYSTSYKEAIAIGLNGYDEQSGRVYEIETYYVSLDNYCIPKRLKAYADLSFLLAKNIDKLVVAPSGAATICLWK